MAWGEVHRHSYSAKLTSKKRLCIRHGTCGSPLYSSSHTGMLLYIQL